MPIQDAPIGQIPQVASGAPNVSAPPQAFGATVLGQGLSELGQAAEGTSNALSERSQQLQALNNKAGADSLGTTFAQQSALLREKWFNSPEGAGHNAAATLPAQLAAEEKLRKDIVSSAPNPLQAEMVDEYTRRVQNASFSAMASRAAEQGKVYRVQAYKGAQQTATDLIAANPDLMFDHSPGSPLAALVSSQAAYDNEVDTPAEMRGVGVRELLGKTAGYVTEALVKNGKVDAGQAFLERARSEGTISGVQYQETLARIAPAVRTNQAFQDADVAVATALHQTRQSDSLGLPAPSLGALTQSQADAFHANPGKVIGDILGTAPLQVNSKDRTPGQEAALSGPTSSEHIPGNGFAADLQLPPGISHSEAIAKIRAAGLPVDQFGVDGGALHVGFKPVGVAGRNAIIGQEGQPGGVSTAAMTGGPMTSYQLEAARPQVLAHVAQLTETRYPGDATYRGIVEARAETQLNHQIQAAKGAEDQVGQLASAALGAAQINRNDPATVAAAVGLDLWNRATPLQHRQLIAQATNQSNNVPGSLQEKGRLDYEMALAKAGTSDAFMKEDILANPFLGSTQAAYYLKARSDIQGGRAQASQKDSAFAAAWGSSDVTGQLTKLGIAANSPQMAQVGGLLHGEFDAWYQDPKHDRPPTPAEVRTQILPHVWIALGKTPQAATLTKPLLDTAAVSLAADGNAQASDFEIANRAQFLRRLAIDHLHSTGQSWPTEAQITAAIQGAVQRQTARQRGGR